MGFSTIIDILGASIIGGFLLFILLRLNSTATENTYFYGGELIVQTSLVEVVTLLEHDFRKIGFCADWSQIPDPSKAILYADTSKIIFLTDLESDGIVDSLTYFTGPTSELAGTDNPRDILLYRVENDATPRTSNLGVTKFKITYFNALGNELTTPVAVPGEIYTMQIDIFVENYTAYDDNYSKAFWRQIRLAARNLKNR